MIEKKLWLRVWSQQNKNRVCVCVDGFEKKKRKESSNEDGGWERDSGGGGFS